MMAGGRNVVQRTLGFEAASVVWAEMVGVVLEPMDAAAGCSVSGCVVSWGLAGASRGLSTHAAEQRGKPLRKRKTVLFPSQTALESLRGVAPKLSCVARS